MWKKPRSEVIAVLSDVDNSYDQVAGKVATQNISSVVEVNHTKSGAHTKGPSLRSVVLAVRELTEKTC